MDRTVALLNLIFDAAFNRFNNDTNIAHIA